MAVSHSTIETAARLARIRLDAEQLDEVTRRIGEILDMVDQMKAVDTSGVAPLANPHDASQRLRPDAVSEADQREAFQALAPQVEDGLYLVPRVVE
jgi:aspartyl-tRNA(Asn)/glutamyl-tRNA(Gln) amidotransferase subunit C